MIQCVLGVSGPGSSRTGTGLWSCSCLRAQHRDRHQPAVAGGGYLDREVLEAVLPGVALFPLPSGRPVVYGDLRAVHKQQVLGWDRLGRTDPRKGLRPVTALSVAREKQAQKDRHHRAPWYADSSSVSFVVSVVCGGSIPPTPWPMLPLMTRRTEPIVHP